METFAKDKQIPVLVNIHDVNLAKRFAIASLACVTEKCITMAAQKVLAKKI